MRENGLQDPLILLVRNGLICEVWDPAWSWAVQWCGDAGLSVSILKIEMTQIRRLIWRLGQELVRRPEARTKAKEVLDETQRIVTNDIKPRAEKAWRDAQPEIEKAKRRLKSFAEEFREEYRKGRDGE